MRLDEEQLQSIEQDGYIILPELFSVPEVDAIRDRLAALFADDHAGNIIERESGVVRTTMGLHLRDELFGRLVRHPRLIEPAMQLLGDALYVQQVKVNVKAAFSGEVWQWHYDFATHHGEDGVPAPLALNLHIFLDDVSQFNGPLYFIPGSHHHGAAKTHLDVETTSYPLWVVDPDTVTDLVEQHGMVAATGKKGTALIFCDNLVHGSPNNMSPWDRAIFSLIVNRIDNAYTRSGRPDHKHHRDLTPVAALGDDCLIT